jgi:long-chain acyl-CoA synthetase
LAEFQRIRRCVVWPDGDFPRTSTQKPQIRLIQELVNSRFSHLQNRKAESGMLVDLIARITGIGADNISKNTNLAKDLNLSSIERVELLSVLEDRFQLDLDESKFTTASTVGDLEKMLSRPGLQRTGYPYPHWAQSTPVSILRILVYYLLIWPATLFMAYPRTRGRENLRHVPGPILFVSNHITQVDIGFILAALPPRFRHRLAVAMIGEMLKEMRDPPSGTGFVKRWTEKISYALVVALFNVFPLPQQSGFRESFAFAGESADRGWSILVFPEGKRTLDGKMNPFRAGIGLLATNLNTAVVPIRIDGLFELKSRNQKFARPGTVSVSIGTPVRYERGKDASEIAADLELRVKSLAV